MIGSVRIELATVDSTNKHAADLLRLTEVQHGTVILAHEQTQGRGQRDRSWHSEPGLDLTFSVVLRPAGLAAGHQFVLAQFAALAVRDALLRSGLQDVQVKWPNDVLVGPRKVAGILIQNELQGGLVRHAVVGIGLNVNSSGAVEGALATSVRLELGRPADREALLCLLLDRLELRWRQAQGHRPGLEADYREALWGRGRWLTMELDGALVEARPLEVDGDGRLLVELAGGGVAPFGLDRLRFGPR